MLVDGMRGPVFTGPFLLVRHLETVSRGKLRLQVVPGQGSTKHRVQLL